MAFLLFFAVFDGLATGLFRHHLLLAHLHYGIEAQEDDASFSFPQRDFKQKFAIL